MKKARKGFTLIELLVVIAIMGILGGMAMIGGQEATNAAKAAKIIDGLEKGSAAMMSYYIDIHTSIDKAGKNEAGTTAAKIAEGASAYLRSDTALVDGTTVNNVTGGKYFVALPATGTGPSTPWWIGYKFNAADGDNVKAIVANKVALNLKKNTTSDDAFTSADTAVYMKVRP